MAVLSQINILCVLPVIGDTKDAKRIDLLLNAGYNVKVIAFERDYYSARSLNCEIVKLPRIEHGKYLKRIFIMLKSLFLMRRHVKKCDVVYAFSPDLAIFTYLSSLKLNKPLVMDVADIREIQVSNSLVGRLLRLIERFVTNRVELLVVSSVAFINEYYLGKLQAKVKSFLLLENKVDYSFDICTDTLERNQDEVVTLGYFGYLRDNWTIKLLIEITQQLGDSFKVKLAGVDMLGDYNVEELCDKNNNFSYYGPYKSPDELSKIYNDIDVVVIFYPDSTDNKDWFNAKRICRSNRFYEACFFKKPIITFSFTEDGRHVKANNIGITLDSYDINFNVEILKTHFTQDNLKIWKLNMFSLNRNVYCLTDESTQLRNRILQIYENYK